MSATRSLSDAEFSRRAQSLEWLLFDVDGVLTDGILLYTEGGEELKRFSVRDGLGFRLAQHAALRLGLLSGRRSKPLENRASELDFDTVILGSGDKRRDFERFLADEGTTADRVAYIGDDLPDLPVLHLAVLSFAPADAVPEVREAVHVVLETPGGAGAAREMIERILKARGDWERVGMVFSSRAETER